MTKKRTKEEQTAYMRDYRARQKAAPTELDPQPSGLAITKKKVQPDPYHDFRPWPKPSARKKA